MRVYLDNCCFNRPYDDQTQIKISLESQAKLYIQGLVKLRLLEMASSFILEYENMQNPHQERKEIIADFLRGAVTTIGTDRADEVVKRAESVIKTGVGVKDACHVVCAEMAECDYFITTDARLLKYADDKIRMVSPLDFMQILAGGEL